MTFNQVKLAYLTIQILTFQIFLEKMKMLISNFHSIIKAGLWIQSVKN